MSTTNDLGAVTAYASAVEGGYTGTYEDFCKLEAGFAEAAAEVKDIRVKADGTSASTAGNAVREQITELKNDLKQLYNNTNPSVNGEITFPLAYGYWETESNSLVWHPASNKRYLASVYPIKVDAGDVIHICNSTNTRYFATYSADGSTWSPLINTTNRDKEIPDSGYVHVSVRNEPSITPFTDDEIDTFFDERVVIIKGGYSDNASIRIDNSDSLNGILTNEVGYKQVYITASEQTLSAAVASNIVIPLVQGDSIKIKVALSVTHPEFFSEVRLSVREYNSSSGFLRTTNYTDFTNIIEYTVSQATAAKVSFVFEIVKSSASSVSTGYYENLEYSLAVVKKEESIDSVLTESGDTWEV